jgi:hypothetical protein
MSKNISDYWLTELVLRKMPFWKSLHSENVEVNSIEAQFDICHAYASFRHNYNKDSRLIDSIYSNLSLVEFNPSPLWDFQVNEDNEDSFFDLHFSIDFYNTLALNKDIFFRVAYYVEKVILQEKKVKLYFQGGYDYKSINELILDLIFERYENEF